MDLTMPRQARHVLHEGHRVVWCLISQRVRDRVHLRHQRRLRFHARLRPPPQIRGHQIRMPARHTAPRAVTAGDA